MTYNLKYKLLVCFLALVAARGALADYPPTPSCYTKITKNGAFVLVMLETNSDVDPDKLKEKYPDSGLYPNDGSNVPLWHFEGNYAYEVAVDVCSDGKHLVKRGDPPEIGDKGETEAVSFYRQGKSFKTYSVKDLVPDPDAMPRSTSHYWWVKNWIFDDEKKRLTIETVEGPNCPSQKYLFDITTGDLIKDEPDKR